jgi:hypothetical protein
MMSHRYEVLYTRHLAEGGEITFGTINVTIGIIGMVHVFFLPLFVAVDRVGLEARCFSSSRTHTNSNNWCVAVVDWAWLDAGVRPTSPTPLLLL